MITDRIVECRKIIQSFAIAIAGIGAIPIPFSDFFLMAPLQCAMVMTIARKYDQQITFERAKELIATIAGGFLGRTICSTIMKFIPVVGGMIAMPFAYGWTFGLGEMAILYFETRGNVSQKDLKEGFDKARDKAEKDYSKKKMNFEEALEEIRACLSEEEYNKIKERITFKNEDSVE